VAILFSVLCSVVYGASDFCGGLASRKTAALGVVVLSQCVGLALLLAIMPAFGGMPRPSDWGFGAVCGIAGAGAVLLLYRALSVGTMGIISPVTAVIGAAVPIAFGVAVRHERPSLLATAGIIAALIAVVCVSIGPGGAETTAAAPRAATVLPPGLLEALLAGTFFGAFFIALAQTRPEAGMYPLLSARLASLVLLALGGVVSGRFAEMRVARPMLALVCACGALDLAANVLFILAAHSGGSLSVVAVLTSLYPAATVTLAGIVLGERLVRVQWAGVVMALAGVAAISAAH
jgi:drug/metabolite transporter (DMT)-like permease